MHNSGKLNGHWAALFSSVIIRKHLRLPTRSLKYKWQFQVLQEEVLETPCSLWKICFWPQWVFFKKKKDLDKVSALLPSERCWVCWTAPQLVSGKTLTPRYHCYDIDAACGKLKVSLTAFLPLQTHAHTSPCTTESSSESTERKRQRDTGKHGSIEKELNIHIVQFSYTAFVATFKVLLIRPLLLSVLFV